MLKTDRHLEMPKVGKRTNTIYFKGSHGTIPDSSCVLKNYIHSPTAVLLPLLQFHMSSKDKVYLSVW